MTDNEYMRMSVDLSASGVKHENEPFGAVLVKDDHVVYTNENQIHTMHDPSFHAEAGLIRRFCGEAWDAIGRYVCTALQGGSIMHGWRVRISTTDQSCTG